MQRIISVDLPDMGCALTESHCPLLFVGQVHFAKSDALLKLFHPLRCPPAFVAEPLHEGRNQEHPDDGGV